MKSFSAVDPTWAIPENKSEIKFWPIKPKLPMKTSLLIGTMIASILSINYSKETRKADWGTMESKKLKTIHG
jgi:hypothetical protein